MKLNRKIIIPALTLLVGSALAGSVSSTIAWYQYSTRTTAAYIGTSAGTSGNLKMRIRDYAGHTGFANDWDTTNIAYNDVATYLGEKIIEPITTGAMGKDDALPQENSAPLFYANPVAGFGPLDQWNKAKAANYVVLPLELRFISSNGTATEDLAKNVYLTDLLIQEDYRDTANSKKDLSSAIRVHVSAYQSNDAAHAKNFLISKDGGSIKVVDKLDLDGKPGYDKDYSGDTTGAEYGFGSDPASVGTDILYGANGTENVNQVAYAASQVVPTGAKNNASFAVDENTKVLGSTTADSTVATLYVDVTIWVEGWQPLGTTPNAVWSLDDYVGAMFDVGMQFGVRAAD